MFNTKQSFFLFGNRDVDISLFDLDLSINSSRESGYLRASKIISTSSLLRDEISVISNMCGIISREDTFVDVGANVGIFSSIFSRLSRINKISKVYAFEASPSTYKRLLKNSENMDLSHLTMPSPTMKAL